MALLKFAMKDFLDDRAYKNLSSNTVKAYGIELNTFQSYCTQNEIIKVEDVSQSFIKEYLMHCQKVRGNNPTTRNTKLRTLKTFFNYLEEAEMCKNPLKKMNYVKEEIRIGAFTDTQIRQMLSHFRRNKDKYRAYHSYRDYVIVLTLLGTGIRLGELINLKWNDVNLASAVITVFGKKRELSSIPITDKMVKELAEYRIFCQQHFKELSEHVFTSDRKNGKLTADAVKSVFKRLKDAMSFRDEVRISPHTFRHTFAQKMLLSGCDVFTLQKMLRHTDIKMTEKYLSLWGTALKEQNDKYNPLNNIDV